MDKEKLKGHICDYIDAALEKDIEYSVREHMYAAISEYGGKLYKPSGIKEFTLKVIIRNHKVL